jgi:hypothetical protein
MKSSKTILFLSLAVLAGAAAVWSPASAQPEDDNGGAKERGVEMADHCKSMQTRRQQFRDEAKAQDTLITERLAALTSAPDARKVTLLTGIVTLLAEQRTATNALRASMEDEMANHMMEHMGKHTDKDSGSFCPMMKSANDGPVTPGMPGHGGPK